MTAEVDGEENIMSETEHEIAWRLSRESWLNHEQALRVLRGLDGDEDRARAWIDAWSRLGRIPYPDAVRTSTG